MSETDSSLSKIASILSSGKTPLDQLNAISDVVFESGSECKPEPTAASDYVWNDQMVIEACKEGRQPSDIRLIVCPKCAKASYWNEGSHFTCNFCQNGFAVTSEMADESVSLADWGDDNYPIYE